nr:DegT/DnrJ/EryC1/StrS family aminotransferase [Prosthecobacter sp.]
MFPPYPQADRQRHQAALTQAVQRVFESGSYILGGEVKAFEREFAAHLGAKHVVGLASGTDAIEVMLRAHEIGVGDKVAAPAHAPSAVAAGVRRSGAEVVFADIDSETFTLCPESLDAVLRSPKGRGVKAVLAVHLYGHPVDWRNLKHVANEHGAILLEDCAQAHGASWHGRAVGTLGRAAAFSFYPTKNLAAIGDAGAVVTDDDELAVRLRQLRVYGWKTRFNSEIPGVNSRLDELQAAVLRVKLGALTESVHQRRRLAAEYDSRLGGSAVVKPPVVRGGCEHACHQYVVRSSRRDELLAHLLRAGVPAAVHYQLPLHRQAAFGSNVSLVESERAAAEVISLPLHPYLSEAALDAVCDAIETF